MKNMIGKTVLLERLHEDGKSLDYNCGEYLVVNQSPMTLYCVKHSADAVYAFHSLSSFIMEGTRAWKVVKECETSRIELRKLIDTVQQRITTEMGNEKHQWIESVYMSAQQTINTLKRELNLHDDVMSNGIRDLTITVGICNGKLVVL